MSLMPESICWTPQVAPTTTWTSLVSLWDDGSSYWDGCENFWIG